MRPARRVARLMRMFAGYALRRPEAPTRLPVRLWVEPTSACNLRCVMCPNSLPRQVEKGYMEVELFKRVIDEVSGEVHDVNVHHRGESLLHPRFPEMVAYASGKGILTRLHTNGTILDEKKGRALIEAGLDVLSFSFDGYEKKRYEAIRVGGDFDRTLANVLGFLELKRSLAARKPYTILEVIDFDEDSIHDAVKSEFRSRLLAAGLDRFIVKQPHNWAGSYGCTEDVVAGVKLAPCTFPWFALVVLWNGDVVPCPQDFYAENVVGNVRSQSLEDVWRGEKLGELRREMIRGDLARRNVCARCDMLTRRTFLRIPTPNLRTFIKEMF